MGRVGVEPTTKRLRVSWERISAHLTAYHGEHVCLKSLSAAFQYAAKADNDPTRLANDGAVFEITANPVSLVPRKAEFENVGERNLSPEELRRYWHGLDKVGFPVVRAFLRFDVALGGQRGIQLIRTLWNAYDFDHGTTLLKDGKGRGGTTRDHLLPSIGVSRDLRSHMLSHGRTGVQVKHYDRWTYIAEKRQVLEKWAQHLRGIIAGPERGQTTSRRAA
jgi:hypothetical protein